MQLDDPNSDQPAIRDAEKLPRRGKVIAALLCAAITGLAIFIAVSSGKSSVPGDFLIGRWSFQTQGDSTTFVEYLKDGKMSIQSIPQEEDKDDANGAQSSEPNFAYEWSLRSGSLVLQQPQQSSFGEKLQELWGYVRNRDRISNGMEVYELEKTGPDTVRLTDKHHAENTIVMKREPEDPTEDPTDNP